MEKRLGLAFVLIFILIFGTNFLFKQDRPIQNPNPNTTGVEEKKPVSDKETRVEEKPTVKEETPKRDPQEFKPTADIPIETITMENRYILAEFSNQGAVLNSVKLKEHFVSPEVKLDPELQKDPANWLELMYQVREGLPSFSLKEVGESAMPLEKAVWKHQVTQKDNGAQEICFTYEDNTGLVFRKIFALLEGDYHFDVHVEVKNLNPDRDRAPHLMLDGPCGILDEKRPSFVEGPMGVFTTHSRHDPHDENELTKEDASNLKTKRDWSIRSGDQLVYGGITTNYFALLLRPLEGTMVSGVNLYNLLDSRKVEEKIAQYEADVGYAPAQGLVDRFAAESYTNVKADIRLSVPTIKEGETAKQSFMFYAGPKSAELFKRPEYACFYNLVDDSSGFFGGLMSGVRWALLGILNLFFGIFHNWGVAIICLTFVVKAILFPLNRVQQVSMHSYGEKMKKVKPKLDELKKKFKNNKKKFQQAQMQLMRDEGVRPPLMGCMLIFFQLPIFIGLFGILRTSFDLRHSPFCLWVTDLSQADALAQLPFRIPLLDTTNFNLLPILMTVAFYYQQKMMPKPSTGDPQAEQMQKIMKFMPIMFGFMFYNYAAGLSLYWMTSNLISIFEYRFIRKKFPVGGEAKAAQAKPAKA